MSQPVTKTVAILGGGISGLSTAYYIRKKFGDSVRPIIIERTERCGGWVRSVRKDDIYFETGPRTIRPAGLPGLNTLDMVEELGIDKNVIYVPRIHPVSHNRYIFTRGQLVRMPIELSALFKTTPPFTKPLIRAGFRDIWKMRRRDDDDSIYNFVSRRFGSDIADYAIDPIIRGICGGDARKISVKFTSPYMYHLEQKYGSVVLGYLVNRLMGREYVEKTEECPGSDEIGFTNLATTSVKDNWSVWGLEGGLQTLVDKLEDKLVNEMDVTIIRDAPVKTIKFSDERNKPSDTIEVYHLKDGNNQFVETTECNFVISTIPGWRFSKILRKSKPSHPGLWQVLNMIANTDILVTNVLYKDLDIIPRGKEGFGFLVPSNEIKFTPGLEGLLGVVYDTCAFAQKDNTILTVMSKPTKDMIESYDPNTFIEETVQRYLKATLGIDKAPDEINISLSMECIPQYIVGHFEKVEAARAFLRAAKIPLLLCGASYDGVSINECILSARKAVEKLPFDVPS